jgi:hypothetical protein
VGAVRGSPSIPAASRSTTSLRSTPEWPFTHRSVTSVDASSTSCSHRSRFAMGRPCEVFRPLACHLWHHQWRSSRRRMSSPTTPSAVGEGRAPPPAQTDLHPLVRGGRVSAQNERVHVDRPSPPPRPLGLRSQAPSVYATVAQSPGRRWLRAGRRGRASSGSSVVRHHEGRRVRRSRLIRDPGDNLPGDRGPGRCSLLVMTAAFSRLPLGRMLPTRKTPDLLLGSWSLDRDGARR